MTPDPLTLMSTVPIEEELFDRKVYICICQVYIWIGTIRIKQLLDQLKQDI
jgi:hypothetical protein